MCTIDIHTIIKWQFLSCLSDSLCAVLSSIWYTHHKYSIKMSCKFFQFQYFNLIHFLCLKCVLLHRGRICMLLTVHFDFTEFNPGVIRIPLRIRRMSPVVVVDDVSPVVRTVYVDRIRYRCSGVVGVLKTQHSVLFVYCVGDVHRESQEELSVIVVLIYGTQKNSMIWMIFRI